MVTKEQWIAVLALLGRTDRDAYRELRALCWQLALEEKRKKFSRVSRSLN